MTRGVVGVSSARSETRTASSPAPRLSSSSSCDNRVSPIMARLLFVIDVKPPTCFPPEISPHDHFMLNRAWPKPRIFKKRSVKRLCCCKVDVVPDQIHQLKRTHAEIARQSHDAINGLNGRIPVSQYAQRLVIKGTGNPVNDEARSIFCAGWG